MIDFVKGLTQSFPLLFVEDLMDENDWEGFARAHRTLTKTCLIGDDFTVKMCIRDRTCSVPSFFICA